MKNDNDLVASYNQRDLILYALSLGFGTQRENSQEGNDELQYLYEKHPDFVAVPTFCLALGFWAATRGKGHGTSYDIPPFPPVSMSSTGTIPFANLRGDNKGAVVSQYPVLHMSQSVRWHRPLPVPKSTATASHICTRLQKRVLKVAPKSIGTFVTSETTILEDTSNVALCTLQSTFLVLGMPQRDVVPMDESTGAFKLATVATPNDRKPDFEWTYVTCPTQSLAYRLASGDSNKIHVTGDAVMSEILGLEGDTTKPILHGLCTLGIAARAVLLYTGKSKGTTLSQLQCQFSKPVFIGDALQVRVWETNTTLNGATCNMKESTRILVFVVVNKTTGNIVVDKGYARLCDMGTVSPISRL